MNGAGLKGADGSYLTNYSEFDEILDYLTLMVCEFTSKPSRVLIDVRVLFRRYVWTRVCRSVSHSPMTGSWAPPDDQAHPAPTLFFMSSKLGKNINKPITTGFDEPFRSGVGVVEFFVAGGTTASKLMPGVPSCAYLAF